MLTIWSFTSLFVGSLCAIFSVIVIKLYEFVFIAPSLKEYPSPYKSPGCIYRLKYYVTWIYLLIFRKYKKRFNNYSEHGKTAIECGIQPTALQRLLESPAILSTDLMNDELSFMGVNPSTGDLLDVRVARRHPLKGQSWLLFDVNHQGRRRSYEIPSTLDCQLTHNHSPDKWVVNGVKIWCLETNNKWRLQFNGFLQDKMTGEVDHVKFSYIWKPYTVVFDHMETISSLALARALAMSDSSNSTKQIQELLEQYDAWGTFFGTYKINGDDEKELIFRGIRSHYRGNFQWEEVHRFIQVKCYFEDGTVLNFIAISTYLGVPELIWGYIEMPNDCTHRITDFDFDLPRMENLHRFPQMMSIRLKTDQEHFILDINNVDAGNEHQKCYRWGGNKNNDVKIYVSNVRTQLTNVTSDIIVDGSGTVEYGLENNDTNSVDGLNTKNLFSHVQDLIQVRRDCASRILLLSDPCSTDSRYTGGKGSSLAVLKSISSYLASSPEDHLKFEVPNGLCVTMRAYEKHVESNTELQIMIKKLSQATCGRLPGDIKEISFRVMQLFESSELNNALQEDIKRQLNNLYGDSYANVRFAVRSSATGEDGEEMSAAGQLDTFLGCCGLDNIFEAIKKCWGSCYGYRAIQYRRQNGQLIDTSMCVIIQEMVGSDVAGVMFTRDPVTGSPGIISISANYGLGETVVSASSEPDTIIINRTYDDKLSLGEIQLGTKQLELRMKDGGGVEKVTKEDARGMCSLDSDQALSLAHIGLMIEQCYGESKDIEWAIKDNTVYLLQARPLTSLDAMTEYELINEFNTPLMTDKDMLTTSNVSEVLPGAVSPLFNTYCDTMFNIALAKLGYLSSSPLSKPTPKWLGASTISKWFRFFNRTNMSYRTVGKDSSQSTTNLVNGFDIALNGRIIDAPEAREHGLKRHRYASEYTLLRRKYDNIWNTIKAKRNLKIMRERFTNWRFDYKKCESAKELSALALSKVTHLINVMYTHIIISISSMCMNTMVIVNLIENSDEITNDQYRDFAVLMSVNINSDEIVSVDVPIALNLLSKEIVKYIDSDKFISMSKDEAVQWLTAEDCPVKDDFESFMKKHGHRCVREFDLMCKPWIMEPQKLVDPLKAAIRNKNTFAKSNMSVDEAIKQLKTKLTPKEKKSIKYYLITAKKYVAYREEAKSLLIRTVHEYRKAFFWLADMMVKEGRIPDPELLFYMTQHEIEKISCTRDCRIIQRASRRRRLHPTLEGYKFPEISYGIPEPITHISYPTNRNENGLLVLKGTPVSQGIVKAVARVVTSIERADEIQPGDVLVTSSTDIAWSPYFPCLSGVITEIGGLISHGAVVAREYGIPCVVSVTHASSILKSGDVIVLNGNDGIIEKLE